MIELKNVTKIYGHTTVIQNAEYSFPNKGLVCLLGESGCGKTTLMNLIAGLDSEYTGKILVDNVELNTLSENELCNYRKDYTGFVFQDYHLLNGYSVIENIVYPCVLKSENPQKDIQQAKELIQKIGLSDKADEKVQNLSGGQKQRVAIARALIKNPKVILADEPTGALDRKTSTEIMEILKDISKTKLVIVITHDRHICDYADEIITIEDKKVCVQKHSDEADRTLKENMTLFPPKKVAHFKLACKNFKTVWLKYFLVSCIFSIGILCMIFSLSSGNIIEKSISDFKEKNVAFNNGYVKNDEKTDIYKRLNTDDRLENVYKQYKIDNVSLSMDTHSETMAEKYPMPKAKESMSYGTMPQNDKKEIALTPSLAKKFNSKINELIGKELILEYQSKKYVLKVSGIYNAGYDDFFVSSDIEKEFYKGLDDETYYSINYDVKDFENIVAVSDELAKEKIQSENASEQVKTMQNTFGKIQTLFMVISGMILFVAMFVVIVILIKMQSTRYKMVGLLYSFGFQKNMVSKIIVSENILLTILVAVISSLLLMGMQFIARSYHIDINLSVIEFVATILISGLVILIINAIINRKLINTRPNIALRK